VCATQNPFNISAIRELKKGWFSIDNDTIIYNLTEILNPLFQIRQVYPSPLSPLISAIERLHYAIIQQHKHIV